MACLQTLRQSYQRNDLGDEQRAGVVVCPCRAMHRDLIYHWNLENAVEQGRPNVVEDMALDWVTSRSQDSPKWEVTTAVGGKLGFARLPQHLHYQPWTLE